MIPPNASSAPPFRLQQQRYERQTLSDSPALRQFELWSYVPQCLIPFTSRVKKDLLFAFCIGFTWQPKEEAGQRVPTASYPKVETSNFILSIFSSWRV